MPAGTIHFLYLYDIAEEIDLAALRNEPLTREPIFRQPAPDYVRFENPPVVEALAPITMEDGAVLEGSLAWYDYGVAAMRLQRPFSLGWAELVQRASVLMSTTAVEAQARMQLQERLERARPALRKAYDKHIGEDYIVVRLDPEPGFGAEQLTEKHGAEIAQIVRGEAVPLAADEVREILGSRMSYYPNDLAVIGWSAAVLYDTADAAASTIQLLEYANSQLLEFRYYDELLTRKLAEVYRALDQGTGWVRRWRMAREARELNSIRLDVRELTERADTAIKFLSDMFSARLYRMAANKVGVPDYRKLVDEKLQDANELYHFMNERFHQSSALMLELMVVIILIIDLIYLFRGKGLP